MSGDRSGDATDVVPDGGTVTEETAGGSGGSALAGLRERDDFVVVAMAAALVVFPFLLIDILGAVGDGSRQTGCSSGRSRWTLS